MSMQTADRNARDVLRANWKMFLLEGVVLVVLGALAVLLPAVATLTVTIFAGWLFLIAGALGLYTTYKLRHAPGFWWSLISAALAVLVGLLLVARPASGALSLTLVLVWFFILEGVVSIMYALAHRDELAGRWTWMVLSGVIDLVLAGLILAGLPMSAAWAIGLLVGINMLMGGGALIGFGLQARNL